MSVIVGDVFESRYQVEAILGRGGFATVYRARRLSDGVGIAIKVLQPDKNGRYPRELEQRFERELQILAKLRSPYIVAMHDFGRTQDGLLYLTMELVPGVDLSEFLQQHGRVEPEIVVHVVRQVASALDEAHRIGVLHRDLKPENIRIHTDGDDPYAAKLLDFGIARQGGLEASLASVTRTGEIVGTPRYMSPEQLADRELTPASDVYSLGVVAFEMLAGEKYMHGAAWADQLERMMSGHLFAAPEVGGTAERLLAIIQRMTARRVDQRIQDIGELLRALDGQDAEPAEPRQMETLRRIVGDPHVDDQAPTEKREPTSAVALWQLALAATVIGAVLAALLTGGDEAPQRVVPRASNSTNPLAAAEDASTADANVVDADVAQHADKPDMPPVMSLAETLPAELVGQRQGCRREPFKVGLWERFPSDEAVGVPPGVTWIPADYEVGRPYPVIVMLHRDGDDGLTSLKRTGLIQVAGSDAIILAPTFPEWSEVNVRPQLNHVLTWLSDRLCIDPHRIFMVTDGAAGVVAEMNQCGPMLAGVALNGHRPYRGQEGEIMQAVVNFASSPNREFSPPQCEDLRPIPAIVFSPLKSKIAPFDNSTSPCLRSLRKLSLPDYEKQWRETNECGEEKKRIAEKDGAECWEFGGCVARFVSCRIPGKFSWPGATMPNEHWCESSEISHTFPATEEIWRFFQSVPSSADAKEVTWKPRRPRRSKRR